MILRWEVTPPRFGISFRFFYTRFVRNRQEPAPSPASEEVCMFSASLNSFSSFKSCSIETIEKCQNGYKRIFVWMEKNVGCTFWQMSLLRDSNGVSNWSLHFLVYSLLGWFTLYSIFWFGCPPGFLKNFRAKSNQNLSCMKAKQSAYPSPQSMPLENPAKASQFEVTIPKSLLLCQTCQTLLSKKVRFHSKQWQTCDNPLETQQSTYQHLCRMESFWC